MYIYNMCPLPMPLGAFASLKYNYNQCEPHVAADWQHPNKSPKWCADIE